MKPGRASATAAGAAAYRAAHLHVFDGPKIHADTFALALAGLDGPEALRASVERHAPPALRRICAYFALRHRFSEDRMRAAVARGVRQVVLLGAGLDSFALRHPEELKALHFVEVDHPDSQHWKLERLRALGLVAEGVRYLPVDFGAQDLARELARAGVDPARPTFFAWLGVSQYVSPGATAETFALVSRHAPGSEIVFDVILPLDGLSGEEREISSFAEAGSRSRDEPWISFFLPDPLEVRLRALGFARVECLTPEAAIRYYAGQPEDVTPLHCWQLMAASR